MSNKEKWLTILVCFVLLILCTSIGAYKKKEVTTGIKTVEELKGKALGGVESRMPDNSAKIFFESMLGVKLSRYSSYKNIDEALYALRTGKVAAIWAADVTADYLVRLQENAKDENEKTSLTFRLIEDAGTASIMELPEGRFDFGFAVKNNKKGQELVESLNEAIKTLKADGKIEELSKQYIYEAEKAEKFTGKNMMVSSAAYKQAFAENKTLTVGITGAVPPVELLDEDGDPYGFCVAFMDEIGLQLGRNVEFVVLDNETIFSSLMSGRIDAVFCYGTPGKVTTEGTKNWIMSDGYLSCAGYKLISVEAE
ncbi:MAG: transporter substrate-binding domain-containing protein [Lachnospiraceae bacterium]|nr:transporter substrate-binding domain-containing protein [Lachnospiraceae bacterium]